MTSGQTSRAAERAERNRANAQHSTGPRTAQGRANSSKNSFKHGLYSKQLCLSLEDDADLDNLKADLRAEHQPTGPTEEILVNELAEQFWRVQRARLLETTILEGQAELSQLSPVQRMMSAAERGFHKALTTLHQFQKERGFVPQSALPSADLSLDTDVPPELLETDTEPISVSDRESVSVTAPQPVAASASGFVPQSADFPLPPDDVDPMEWAREHDPEVYELYVQDMAELERIQRNIEARQQSQSKPDAQAV